MPNPTIDLTDKIPGWGSDLPLANRPGVPREKNPEIVAPAYRTDVEQQEPKVKIFYTIERPTVTPVFGTTCPPRGLSGFLREKAYALGEGRISRWLTLYFADRVDVVEGMILDRIRSTADGASEKRLGFSKGAFLVIGLGTLAVMSTALFRRRLDVR